jgi:hypothetical protein
LSIFSTLLWSSGDKCRRRISSRQRRRRSETKSSGALLLFLIRDGDGRNRGGVLRHALACVLIVSVQRYFSFSKNKNVLFSKN